ncbi:MAG: DMT family transporter [Pseudomonadota bacterium]
MSHLSLARASRPAILYMVAAVVAFSIMDATAKSLAPRIGIMPTLWARYLGQMLVVIVLILPRARTAIRTRHLPTQILRATLLMAATGFFFMGLSLIPLSEATALMLINPVLITLGASVFLGEHLGPRRIAGIAIAMVGALIVLRPGSSMFSPNALYPLLAACCYSGYVLLTRRLGPNENVWTSLFYAGTVGTVILSAIIPFVWVPIDSAVLGYVVLMATAGTAGHLCLIRAFSIGEASMLAPYTYVGLVTATFWGFSIYGEVPDTATILGAIVICGAGLYVWYRETLSS